MKPGRRLSGLQKQVLGLYRTCLRAAVDKDPAADKVSGPWGFLQAPAAGFVRSEFRRQAAAIDRKDVERIEYFIRLAEKKLESLDGASVSTVQVVRR